MDFELYNHNVDEIIAAAKKAILQRKDGTTPPSIDLGYASIAFINLPGVATSITTIMISQFDVSQIVGEKEYTGEKGQMRYSDLRNLFASRLDEAIQQLSSVKGCRVVAFDVERFMGIHDLLLDVFIGTPRVRFLRPRGVEWFREADGLFYNAAYSSLNGAVTFIGDSPCEALANPSEKESQKCLSSLGLDGYKPEE